MANTSRGGGDEGGWRTRERFFVFANSEKGDEIPPNVEMRHRDGSFALANPEKSDEIPPNSEMSK